MFDKMNATQMTTLEPHEAASIFPLMEGQAYEELKADIKANGQREPIWIYESKILDGRNRYRACQELDIEPDCNVWDGDGDPFSFVVSLNLLRRHLTTSQRAMVADDLKSIFEAKAKERQTSSLRKGNEPPVEANLPQRENGRSKEKAAEILNVSPRSVESASKVKTDGVPELAAAVKNGHIKVSTAAVVADLPKAEQKTIVEKGPEAIKEKAKEERTKSPKPKPFQPIADPLNAVIDTFINAIGGVEKTDASTGGWGGIEAVVAEMTPKSLESARGFLTHIIERLQGWVEAIDRSEGALP